MTRAIIAIDETNEEHRNMLQEFCLDIEKNEADNPTEVNMRFTGWETNPACLFHVLYKERRFSAPGGQYIAMIEGNKIISGCGVYLADGVAVLLARTWTLPNYRSEFILHEHLLPALLNWARSNNAKSAVVTFNEYNKGHLVWWRRLARQKDHPMRHLYKDAIISDEPELIKNVPQWTVKFNLD